MLRTTSPFKELEGEDQDASPKPRQTHFKSRTLGFSVPADIGSEQRAVISARDGKPTAVQALSLREASDRRGVTVHAPRDVVNSTQKDTANSTALDVAARAARDQAGTLVKLGWSPAFFCSRRRAVNSHRLRKVVTGKRCRDGKML